METDDPPDSGGGYVSSVVSPPLFSQSVMEDSTLLNRKRCTQIEPERPIKKTISNISHASASIQTTYSHPDFTTAKFKYLDSDCPPFIVNIQKKDSDSVSGTSLRTIKLGHFLYENKIQGVAQDGLKRIGRNRFSVEFKTAFDANEFISNPVLSCNDYEAVIPSYAVTRMGIVRNIPVDWSMEKLVDNAELPPGYGRVIKARRLNRKSSENGSPVWIPTQSVVITFSGQKLPDKIFCFFTSLPVELYLLPTIQCNKCCRFGHVKSQCRSKPRCYKCAQGHEGESCSAVVPTCLFCSGDHCANSQICPEHFRQKNIKSVMSQENLSYMEASLRFPNVRKSFADAIRGSSPLSSSFPPVNPATCPPKPNSPLRSLSSSPSGSYRKTVISPQRPFSAASSHGYDHLSHSQIVSTPTASLPNGHALNDPPPISPNDNLIEILVSAIISIISRFNDTPLPYHLHHALSALSDTINKIPSNSSVELSKQ